MEENRFRKIYALIPEDTYLEIQQLGWFKIGRFDSIVSELLAERIEKEKEIQSKPRDKEEQR